MYIFQLPVLAYYRLALCKQYIRNWRCAVMFVYVIQRRFSSCPRFPVLFKVTLMYSVLFAAFLFLVATLRCYLIFLLFRDSVLPYVMHLFSASVLHRIPEYILWHLRESVSYSTCCWIICINEFKAMLAGQRFCCLCFPICQ